MNTQESLLLYLIKEGSLPEKVLTELYPPSISGEPNPQLIKILAEFEDNNIPVDVQNVLVRTSSYCKKMKLATRLVVGHSLCELIKSDGAQLHQLIREASKNKVPRVTGDTTEALLRGLNTYQLASLMGVYDHYETRSGWFPTGVRVAKGSGRIRGTSLTGRWKVRTLGRRVLWWPILIGKSKNIVKVTSGPRPGSRAGGGGGGGEWERPWETVCEKELLMYIKVFDNFIRLAV